MVSREACDYMMADACMLRPEKSLTPRVQLILLLHKQRAQDLLTLLDQTVTLFLADAGKKRLNLS